MEYLLAWRMAVAKDLLHREDVAISEVAERVGYGSASTFITAFSRHVVQQVRRGYARGAGGGRAADGPRLRSNPRRAAGAGRHL